LTSTVVVIEHYLPGYLCFILNYEITVLNYEITEGPKGEGRGKKTWNEHVKVESKRLVLVKNDAHYRDEWSNLTTGNSPTLSQCGKKGVVLYGLRSHDVSDDDDVNRNIIDDDNTVILIETFILPSFSTPFRSHYNNCDESDLVDKD